MLQFAFLKTGLIDELVGWSQLSLLVSHANLVAAFHPQLYTHWAADGEVVEVNRWQLIHSNYGAPFMQSSETRGREVMGT